MSHSHPVDDFVMTTIANTCNVERAAITAYTSVSELGMDSLGLTAFVAHVEAAYDLELTAGQIVGLFEASRVEEIVRLVRSIVAPLEPRLPDESDPDAAPLRPLASQ